LIGGARRRGSARAADQIRDVLLRQIVERMEKSEAQRKKMMASADDCAWPPSFLHKPRP
jgi:hypothetical protein